MHSRIDPCTEHQIQQTILRKTKYNTIKTKLYTHTKKNKKTFF